MTSPTPPISDEMLAIARVPPKPDLNVIPVWVTNIYPERAQDIAEWYFAFHFWRRWDGNMKNLNTAALVARACAEARLVALDATSALEDASEGSIVHQLYLAEQTGWYKYAELESVTQLIEDKLARQIERNPRGGKVAEYRHLLTIIQALAQLGYKEEEIVAIGANTGKGLAASSAMHQILSAKEPEPEKLELVTEMLHDIADPKITVARFNERNKERLGKVSVQPPDPISGALYLATGGREIVILDSDKTHTPAIEKALDGLVRDLQFRDGAQLLTWLTEVIKPRASNQHYMALDKNGTLTYSSTGVLLPTPEEFGRLAIGETIRAKSLINQLLICEQPAWLPLTVLSEHLADKELDAFLIHAFGYTPKPNEYIINVLNRELTARYSVPYEVKALFPENQCHLEVDVMDACFGIYLVVAP